MLYGCMKLMEGISDAGSTPATSTKVHSGQHGGTWSQTMV